MPKLTKKQKVHMINAIDSKSLKLALAKYGTPLISMNDYFVIQKILIKAVKKLK